MIFGKDNSPRITRTVIIEAAANTVTASSAAN